MKHIKKYNEGWFGRNPNDDKAEEILRSLESGDAKYLNDFTFQIGSDKVKIDLSFSKNPLIINGSPLKISKKIAERIYKAGTKIITAKTGHNFEPHYSRELLSGKKSKDDDYYTNCVKNGDIPGLES